MYSFETPEYLFLLFLLPVAVFFRHFWKKRGGRIPFAVSLWNREYFQPGNSLAGVIAFLSHVSFWCSLGCIIIALAGPGIVRHRKVFLSRGLDMMIVLDLSPSMAAQDFAPDNRFESARQVIKDLVQRRENDPIGLVTFGLEAALRIPPTVDYDMVLQRLEDLRILEMGDGTAIGMGIAVACLHLQQSTAGEKVIVLITDGENNAGAILPEAAAELAAGLGIRVYAIGIGSEGEVPLEYTDPATGKTYRGQFVSGFDEELLVAVAERTGGKYFSSSSQGTLEAVIRTIDSMESIEKRVSIQTETEEKYRTWIAASLGCFLLWFFLSRLVLKEVW
ncbi:MAG: VWA domain-containing protein [Spirochaetales bacterium]|nr:VWA domain-containing protein [Spirochaetales bacterium]